MQLGTYTTSEEQDAVIAKYGFRVTTDGSNFVIRHPNHKKLGKFNGGNLTDLLRQASDAVDKLHAARPPKQQKKDPPKEDDVQGKEYAQQVLYRDFDSPVYQAEWANMAPVAAEPDTILASWSSTSKVEPAPKPKKEKKGRDQSKLAFLQTMAQWIRTPDATPEQVFEAVKQQGIKTTLPSVVMLRHMLKTALAAKELVDNEKP